MEQLPYTYKEASQSTGSEPDRAVGYVHYANSFLRTVLGRFDKDATAFDVWKEPFSLVVSTDIVEDDNAVDLLWDTTNGDINFAGAEVDFVATITEDPELVALHASDPFPAAWDVWEVWVEGYYDERVEVTGALVSGEETETLTINLMPRWGYRGQDSGGLNTNDSATDVNRTADVLIYARHPATNRLVAVELSIYLKILKQAKYCSLSDGCYPDGVEPPSPPPFKDGRWKNYAGMPNLACTYPAAAGFLLQYRRPGGGIPPDSSPCDWGFAGYACTGDYVSAVPNGTNTTCFMGACTEGVHLAGVAVWQVPIVATTFGFLNGNFSFNLRQIFSAYASMPQAWREETTGRYPMDVSCFGDVYDEPAPEGIRGTNLAMTRYFQTSNPPSSLDGMPKSAALRDAVDSRSFQLEYVTGYTRGNIDIYPLPSGLWAYTSSFYTSERRQGYLCRYHNSGAPTCSPWSSRALTPWDLEYGEPYWNDLCPPDSGSVYCDTSDFSVDGYPCTQYVCQSFNEMECDSPSAGWIVQGTTQNPSCTQVMATFDLDPDDALLKSKNVGNCLAPQYKSDEVFQPFPAEVFDPDYNCEDDEDLSYDYRDRSRLYRWDKNTSNPTVTDCLCYGTCFDSCNGSSPTIDCSQRRSCIPYTPPIYYDCGGLHFTVTAYTFPCSGYYPYGPEVPYESGDCYVDNTCASGSDSSLPPGYITSPDVTFAIHRTLDSAESACPENIWEPSAVDTIDGFDAWYGDLYDVVANLDIGSACPEESWLRVTRTFTEEEFFDSFGDQCEQFQNTLACSGYGCSVVTTGVAPDITFEPRIAIGCDPPEFPAFTMTVRGINRYYLSEDGDLQTETGITRTWQLGCPSIEYYTRAEWLAEGLPQFYVKNASPYASPTSIGSGFPREYYSQQRSAAVKAYSFPEDSDYQFESMNFGTASRVYIEYRRPKTDGGVVEWWLPIVAGGLSVGSGVIYPKQTGGKFFYSQATDTTFPGDEMLLNLEATIRPYDDIGAQPASGFDGLSLIMTGEANITTYPEDFWAERWGEVEYTGDPVPFRQSDDATEGEIELLVVGEDYACSNTVLDREKPYEAPAVGWDEDGEVTTGGGAWERVTSPAFGASSYAHKFPLELSSAANVVGSLFTVNIPSCDDLLMQEGGSCSIYLRSPLGTDVLLASYSWDYDNDECTTSSTSGFRSFGGSELQGTEDAPYTVIVEQFLCSGPIDIGFIFVDKELGKSQPKIDPSMYMRCFPIGWYQLTVNPNADFTYNCCQCNNGSVDESSGAGTFDTTNETKIGVLGFYGPRGAPPGSVRAHPEFPEEGSWEYFTSSSSSSSSSSSASSLSSG